MTQTKPEDGKKKIIIAGISGFIGRNLGRQLRSRYHVIGISRILPDPGSEAAECADEWRKCDLFSLFETESALVGAEYAFYLVHSMMPSARLTQGDFWDFDLIAADNFARAAQKAGVKQLFYLGGIIPGRDVLSNHLASRQEVETALKGYGSPVTTLRAGLVIGAEGSSFLALVRTIDRLPVLFYPPWGDTLSHPIALGDVLELLTFCLDHPETHGETYEIGGPELMSYRAMMCEIAKQLGKTRPALPIPFGNTRVIQRYVSWASGAPRELVLPLIESLRYPIVVRERKLNTLAGIKGTPFSAAVREALATLRDRNRTRKALPIAFQKQRLRTGAPSSVRSVQRFILPPARTAEWFAREYLSWIPKGLKFLFNVKVTRDNTFSIHFRLLPTRPLLILERSTERSWPDRWLFWIKGGMLVSTGQRPGHRQRLEFREVLGKFVLASIQDYRPRLPWFIYLYTQARIHLWVMNSFRRYLTETVRPGTSQEPEKLERPPASF